MHVYIFIMLWVKYLFKNIKLDTVHDNGILMWVFFSCLHSFIYINP